MSRPFKVIEITWKIAMYVVQNLCNSNFVSKASIDNGYTELIGALKNSAIQSFPLKKYKQYLKPYCLRLFIKVLPVRGKIG